MLDALARIGAAVPGRVFWFLARGTDDLAIDNLRREAARSAIAHERVAFATGRPNAQ